MLDLLGDVVVQVGSCHAQLLAAILVDQLHGRAVLLGPLEVVARHVVAEDALGQLVLLEEWRAGEADESRIRKRGAHVARQPASLRAMGLVRDHDDVVALAIGLRRLHVLLELLDQTEDISGDSPFSRLLHDRSPVAARGVMVVGNAAADERLVDLAVQIVAVRHQQEGEVALRASAAPSRRRTPWSRTCRCPACARTRQAGLGRDEPVH